jgi:signal peptidase
MIDALQVIKKMKFRKLITQFIVLGMVISSALMMWKSLMLVFFNDSPIVVVLTGSMEPSFHRGDILFITWDYTPPESGDIVVFKVPSQEIPIVHRVIATQVLENGDYNCLTKGDNNEINDRGLYEKRQLWLTGKNLFGRIKGFCPYVGIITILLNDYPLLKWIVLGLMGLFVIIGNNPDDN